MQNNTSMETKFEYESMAAGRWRLANFRNSGDHNEAQGTVTLPLSQRKRGC
jgi:hypothetical protein